MEKDFWLTWKKEKKMIWEHMITFKKITTGQGDDCTTGCLLDYPYFK